MIKDLKKYIKKNLFASIAQEKGAAEAYNIWSDDYDRQPDNLMLALDDEIVSKMLNSIVLENKVVADIGCGTGRHWDKLFSKKPAVLQGYDVSIGMLERLKQKYPQAKVQHVIDNSLPQIPDAFFDTLVCTLTIAHIADAAEAIGAWSRTLKPEADILLTDFHPDSLAAGGRRTFSHGKGKYSITNYVHPIDALLPLFNSFGFKLVEKEERRVDETVKHFYAKQNAGLVYEKFKGMPIIYGLRLRRGNDS